MENQSSQLSDENYKCFKIWIVKRDDPILITLNEYNGLIGALAGGKNFVKVGWNIIMLNSITLIEPIQRPKNQQKTIVNPDGIEFINESEKEQLAWDKIFNQSTVPLIK